MAKLTLSDLVNLQNETSAIATLNNNSDAIETAIENTLSRDGTAPNQMGADLDMNSHRILNLPEPVDPTEPARLTEIVALVVAGLAPGAVTTTYIGDSAVTTAKLNDNSVTNAKLRDSTALSVLGRSVNSSGDPADIAFTVDGHVIVRSGTSLISALLSNTNISSSAAIDASKLSYTASGGTARALSAKFGERVSVKDYGALGDGVEITGNCSITSSTAILTVTGASFTSADIGKKITVPGAGAASGVLKTSIIGWTSSTVVTLLSAAGTTLSAVSKTVQYGTDDLAAINLAIASLPVSGGYVFFPQGRYCVSGPVNCGDGTSSGVSTRYGIRLIGAATGNQIGMFASFPALNAGVTIVATSAIATSGVVNFRGPMQGWELENIAINGNNIADRCLYLPSAQWGSCRNVSLKGALVQTLGLDTVASSIGGVSAGAINCMHNNFYHTTIYVSDVLNAAGVVLTGTSATNTCFNNFYDTAVIGGGTGVAGFGISFQACDNNYFYDTHYFNGGSSLAAVTYDYAINASWPSNNMFFGLDPGTGYTLFQNSGSPNSSARPNMIYGLSEGNGGTIPTNIPNLIPPLPYGVTTYDATAQSANIGATTLFTPWATGTYRVNYYLGVSTASGTGTVNVGVSATDDASQAQVQTSSNLTLSALTNIVQGSWLMRCKTGVAVQFVTTTGGTIGAGRYHIHLQVERMTQ